MKLIFVHHWGDEGCSGTLTIPFEYESKEKFLFDLFEKYNDAYWKENPWNCQVLDYYMSKNDFDQIEYCILTLEDWFEHNKEIPKI